MTQNTLNDEIERELETIKIKSDVINNSLWYINPEDIRQSLRSIAEKTVEAVRVKRQSYLEDAIGFSEGDVKPAVEDICFENGCNVAITEQSKLADQWLGKDK